MGKIEDIAIALDDDFMDDENEIEEVRYIEEHLKNGNYDNDPFLKKHLLKYVKKEKERLGV